MLNVLRRGQPAFQPVAVGAGWTPDADVVWIDLQDPTRDEELAVEAALGLELPTMEEMAALEPSSRLYQESGATFMTATLLTGSDSASPSATPATFVLAGGRLITLRYADLKAFDAFADRARNGDLACGASAMLGLLDAVVERLGQVLDRMGHKVETVSTAIFRRPPSGNFRPMLTGLAEAQSVTTLTRASVVSLARLVSFAQLAPEMTGKEERHTHLKSLQRDTQSLTEHASYLSSHISFLLDAALGLINIEQNGIIKFFSVVAVVFMPPTLIASIYGMNFDVMPELHWRLGYPFVLILMVFAAILPVLWFKRRGWL